jgi:hypothetical protein
MLLHVGDSRVLTGTASEAGLGELISTKIPLEITMTRDLLGNELDNQQRLESEL